MALALFSLVFRMTFLAPRSPIRPYLQDWEPQVRRSKGHSLDGIKCDVASFQFSLCNHIR